MVEVIERLESATAEDADAAIDRAKAAFPGWRDVESADRARILPRLAPAADRALEEPGRETAAEIGGPYVHAEVSGLGRVLLRNSLHLPG